MKKNIIIVILLFLTGMPVKAEFLNFDDFLLTALDNSFKLKISQLDTQITKKGIKEARAEYLPAISAFATTERYNDLTDGRAPLTAVGNELFLNRSYYQDMAAIGLYYNLFDFGIRKKQLEIAKADDKQKEIVLKKNAKDLRLDAIDIYAKALSLYKYSLTKNETYRLQNELLEINKKLRLAGTVSEIDIVDNEIKLNETKSELDNINNNLAKKLTEVSYYTNKKYNIKDIHLADFPKINSYIKQTENDKEQTAIEAHILNPENTPEAKAYDLEIYKKQKEYEMQKKANYPRIRFDTRYSFYGSDPDKFFSGIGDISQRSLSFRLSTSFVLFDGFKNINTAAKYKIEIEKLKVEKEEQIANLKKEYEQLQLDSANAIIQNENNIKTLELINKNLEMLERLNTNGIIEKSDCIKKRLILLEKKSALEQNQIDFFVAQYKLQLLENEGINL